ncbi:MAG: DMT family transporter [bacterium]|nr:DMT family transporter [bacterium]
MVSSVIITIFASFLWAITNHIDKFLVNGASKSSNNIKTLLVFSSLVAGLLFAPIWLIFSKFSVGISLISLLFVFLAAIVYMLATYFYLKALDNNDASVVVVMFQLIPVFSYILALIFFNEGLSIKQFIGSIIITLSAIIISIDIENKNSKAKLKPLLLMMLSSLSFSLYYILFDFGIRNSSYNSCAFWFQIGFIIIGLIFISIKSFRNMFVEAIKLNGKKYFSLNAVNEIINLVANMLVNYANVFIPIALANVLNGFQGAFVFIIGVIGVKLLPKYFNENLKLSVIMQKIFCIVLSIIGLIVMFI